MLTRKTQSIWNGVDDPQRPINWPGIKKWTATLILSCFSFLQPLSETMLAPAKDQISNDLNIVQSYQWLLVNSIILIGVGLSPLVLAPLSEVYGRKPVLISASLVFLVWNTAAGASTTVGQLIAFRLLSGFGASVADALAGGLMSDLWRPEERGRTFAVYMAAPLLGPALGPILGAFISQGADWRWIFWSTSSASALVTVLAIVFLHETYQPRLEYLRSLKARESSDPNTSPRHLKALFQFINPGTITSSDNATSFLQIMRTNLQRPLWMLGTQPIIQLLAVYMALLYGTMFLFLFMYPVLWTDVYHESVGIGSLNYISFAIGLILGVNISGFLNDYLYRRFTRNSTGRPEYRVPPMIIGTALFPIGLLWWGWTGQRGLHWILPNIGSLLIGTGVYVCSGCVSVYTIDAYTKYAASAISTNLVSRSIAAAFFPLFAPYLFKALGFGLGATTLAGAFIVVGTVVVSVLWFFGQTLRSRSSYYAAHET